MTDKAERSQFLRTACQGTDGLHEKIATLLIAHDDAGAFLESPLLEPADTSGDDTIEDLTEKNIGPYRVVEQIGEGGFGVVYRAKQSHPIQRQVALKIIKPGMDTKQVVARFEAERQTLALMDDPNIASVFDAGATSSGRPYFVMELVRGVPLFEYCDQQQLTLFERLNIFIDICSAIQHAHEKGIIHRDIKPTNVLVCANGPRHVPKVIDFGIAKVTQDKLTDKTLFTQYQQFIGTPIYMSPEQSQLGTIDVDTRSDIYSMGVLLYELITGVPPVDKKQLKGAGMEEVFRRIRDTEFITPSKRIASLNGERLKMISQNRQMEPARLRARLRGDLDWIVMKATEKDRSRRYRSAADFGDDVQRFLNHEPVTAGPPGTIYHLGKFLRRHRKIALAALLLAIVTLIGTAVSIAGWTQAVTTKNQLANQIAATTNNAYLADMKSAFQALELDNLGLARRILNETQNLDRDLLNWEWRALWSRCRGDAMSSFHEHDSIRSMSIHRDGKWVAVGIPGSIRIRDVFTGALVHEIPCQGESRTQFSRDGELLCVADESGGVRVWHVSNLDQHQFKLDHSIPFFAGMSMEISPNGKVLTTFSGDRRNGQITIWNLTERTMLKRMPTKWWACPIVYTPDSTKLYLGGQRLVIDLDTLKENHARDASKVEPLFSPDGKNELITSDNRFSIIQLSNDQVIANREGHSQKITDAAYSPDGKLFATSGHDQSVLLWNTDGYEITAKLRDHELSVKHVEFSPDGQHLLSAGNAGKICVWNLNDERKTDWPIKRKGYHAWPRPTPQVSCSHDAKSLISTNTGLNGVRGATIFSTKDLSDMGAIAQSCGIINGLLCSPSEPLIAICREDGALVFIDADSKESNLIDQTNGKQILPVEFTPDGNFLLTLLLDFDTIVGVHESVTNAVYSVRDRRLIVSWTTSQQACASISSDGELVVTGHSDGLRFWSLDDLQAPCHVSVGGIRTGDAGLIWSVDFSPDDRFVVAGADLTGRIEIVDVLAKRPVSYLSGHAQHIMAVSFSPDGKRIASGGALSSDALKIWDFESRREILSLRVDGGWSSNQVNWLPDGNSILLLTGNSIVSLWRVPSFEEVQAATAK